MLLELVKMELQLAQSHVKAAQEQLKRLESKELTTPRKKGGLFFKGQTVVYKKTGCPATVLCFPGRGQVTVRSHYNGCVYTRHYSCFGKV